MSTKTLIGIVVVIIITAGFWYFAQKQYEPSMAPTVTQQPATQPTTSVAAGTIIIQNFSFNPEILNVKQGEAVAWINQDTETHNVKSDTFNSPDLGTGDQFQFIFKNKGSFDYVCGIHPSMSGKIIVE